MGRDLLAGLNTVLLATLNGGQGLEVGPLEFSLRDGTVVNDLDFSGAQTLSDVLTVINATGLLRAEVDPGGTRIRVTDLTSGTGDFAASGAMADALGLSGGGMGALVSADLQKQYVTEATRLEDFNPSSTFAYGRIQITNAAGARQTLTLSASLHKTAGDVINAINGLNMNVTARINASGDGIELLDTSGGDGTLAVIDLDGGRTAAELGIRGESDAEGLLAGSLARSIDISATDTLDDIVARINGSSANVSASIINDGSGDTPYRLVLTSKTAGTQGRVLFASDVPALSLSTLSQATDAKVVLGQAGSPHAVVITSDSNTLENVVPGLTLTLHGTSAQPVEVTVNRDVDKSVTDVKTFIKTFNDAMDRMNELTRFVPETNQKGILLGDSTVRQIQSRLFGIVNRVIGGDAMAFNRLSELGIMVDSTGGSPRLTLSRTLSNGTVIDGESRLRAALNEDPEAVRTFFTLMESDEEGGTGQPVGFAARMNAALDQITTTAGGLLATQNQRLADRVAQFERRADHLQNLLDLKESRLYAQFQAMERALADLQAQQSSLMALSNLAANFGSTGGGIAMG